MAKKIVLAVALGLMLCQPSFSEETENNLKQYTDPLWASFQEIPSADGEIGEVYNTS